MSSGSRRYVFRKHEAHVGADGAKPAENDNRGTGRAMSAIMVIAGFGRNKYGSSHSSLYNCRLGNSRVGYLLLEDHPFRTQCSNRVYGLP